MESGRIAPVRFTSRGCFLWLRSGNELRRGNIMSAFHLVPDGRGALEDEGHLGWMVGGLTRLCSLAQHRRGLMARPRLTFGGKTLPAPNLPEILVQSGAST